VTRYAAQQSSNGWFRKYPKQSRSASVRPEIGLGRRVGLSRRAVLTVGTVRFVGHVDFDDGLWIGIELDRRGKDMLLLK
jgi:hypothetical protein